MVLGTHCGIDHRAMMEVEEVAAITAAVAAVVWTSADYVETVQTLLPFVPCVPDDQHSVPGYVHAQQEALTGMQQP